MKTIESNNRFGNITMAILGFSAFTLPAAALAQKGIHRTELQRHDLSIPGREAVQVIVALDPGAAAGAHSHPGEEIIYVTEGVLEYTIEGQLPVTLKAGDVLFIPAGVIHSAKNKGTVRGAELATYIVDKSKPIYTAKSEPKQ